MEGRVAWLRNIEQIGMHRHDGFDSFSVYSEDKHIGSSARLVFANI